MLNSTLHSLSFERNVIKLVQELVIRHIIMTTKCKHLCLCFNILIHVCVVGCMELGLD